MELGTSEEAQEVLAVGSSGERPRWVTWVSLSTMVMAMITAVGILLAGLTLNEFFLERTEELMEASNAGVDRVRIEILETKHGLLESMGEMIDEEEVARIRELEEEVVELEAKVALEDERSRLALLEHELFAVGVTLLSIAITMSAVAVIVSQRRIWTTGLAVGALGACLVAYAIFRMVS